MPCYGSSPDTRLVATIPNVTKSRLCHKEECAAQCALCLENLTKALICNLTLESYEIIPTDLNLETELLSVDEAITAISDSTITPIIDSGDDPSLSKALASPEREYWIAGGRNKLKSLEDLRVFVLVPCSDVPHGQCPLKGKLVCKRK